jgi:hypothetical protein
MLVALAALAISAATGAAAVRVVAVERGEAATRAAVFQREGEHRTLAVVVEDGERCWAEGRLLARGRTCTPLEPGEAASIRWFLAVPRALDYDNRALCGPGASATCHARIAYDAREVPGAEGRGRIDVHAFPDLSALGTHRVGATVSFRGAALASSPQLAPGPVEEDTAEALVQVVVRRDDTYVGYLTEQLGTPFVHAPARLRGGRHQTDARIGADGTTLVVYGRRRMGERLRYVAPDGLLALTRPIADAPVAPGDVLRFGFQPAVLSVDRPPKGRLDPSDLVIHAYRGVAEEVPLGTLPYRDASVDVLRWVRAAGAR